MAIVLGLGSNLGDRLANLRQALKLIETISRTRVVQISPVYHSDALLPDKAPSAWDIPYLNVAIRLETSHEPFTLLKHLKAIEVKLGREETDKRWGPRVLDIDILTWDDLILQDPQLTLPHPGLLERPFALWPLTDVAPYWNYPLAGHNEGKTAMQLIEKWGSRFSSEVPFHTRQINQRIDGPEWVGIINVTPNSFSDGGQFLNPEHALAQAMHLVDTGAHILDIGAESTAPQTQRMDPDTEWTRLSPVIKAIKAAHKNFIIPPKISIDTFHPETAKRALELGVDWINDVTGLTDPAMRDIVAQSKCKCVIMHSLSIPASHTQVIPGNFNAVKVVTDWAMRQLEDLVNSGITRENIIFDPGIGFGKRPEHSLQLIKEVSTFAQLSTQILIGHSRKSFLSLFTKAPSSERDIETQAIALFLAKQPIDYVRVHNVAMCARALKMMTALA